MNTLELKPGVIVIYQAEQYMVQQVIDLENVLLKHLDKSAVFIRAKINHLSVGEDSPTKKIEPVDNISNERWKEAQRRYDIIKPIIESCTQRKKLIKEIAISKKVHFSTLYRWINRFEQMGTISSLVPNLKDGGKGKSRLSEPQNIIINALIDRTYLTNDRFSLKKTYLELVRDCKKNQVDTPHLNTIRNRIKNISEEHGIEKRYGRLAAKERFEAQKGSFPDADYPLSVIQIDHTKVDLELVDDITRKPMGRPWITVALDVYSRMIVGIYLSFDPPGAIGVGMCLYNAILPKELYLNALEVDGDWPCWGVMKKIHVDNAKEFRGNMLTRACSEYGIILEWRPVKRPNWGGHIERLIGTFMKNIHDLPGTTFSNPIQKKDYDSVSKAVFSIKEFEKWLVSYIVNVYHRSMHKAIKTSPLTKFKDGFLGTNAKPGNPLPARVFNERKLKLDFLPIAERTIQQYGIKIDHITYYSDILRKWIHSSESVGVRARVKKKFIVKRDPRDISIIYFLDPELKEYFDVPYRNISHPAITIWEYRESLKRLEEEGRQQIDEDAIFSAYENLREIELNSTNKTIKAKRARKDVKALLSLERSTARTIGLPSDPDAEEKSFNSVFEMKEIKPFDDLENEASS